eukprot:Hpha_TRINITY_DN16480_c1_g2::TRINITY_DN16480_c1_g2_i1::g.163718::m.163718
MARGVLFAVLLAAGMAAGEGAGGAGEVAVTVAEDMTTFVHGRVNLPEKTLRRGGGVRLVVDGLHASYVKPTGSFLLRLAPGSHIVDFATRDVLLPQLRIDVSRKTKGKYRTMFNDKHRTPLHDPIEIEPLGRVEYFEQHEQVNWIGFLKSPSVLMMVLPAAMVFLMPMLVDQDQLKEQMRTLSPNQGGMSGMMKQMQEQQEQQRAAPQRRVQPKPK